MNRVRTAFFLAALAGTAGAGRLAAQGFSPEDAVRRMKVPDDLEVKLVACEPDVRQPVTITFDDSGRMWVIQYLQYPTPAGLKAVKVDQYLRTVYDRVPEAPPKGPKGADRITVLSNPDENGHFRKAKDCIDGLNLASGMCLGYGGVFILQTPYLLFYHFKPGTDEPDGDPEVLLSGFGMEDAHAVANSLQWGPDGWLYGAQGSTVTAHVRGLEFQQGISAVPSDHQGIRAVRGGRRQYVGPRLRRPRRRHRRHQLGRLRHAAPGAGRLLHQGLRQARPPA